VEFGKTAKGYNTDLYGAIEALKTEEPELKGKTVLVLGAGGAARAIVYGCLLENAEVSLHNRTIERAKELAEDVKENLDKKVDVLSNANRLDGFNIIINATSVGMHPKVDETPLTSPIPSNSIVMDIVYNPLETEFLKQAKKAGARTIGGVEMFVRQGAESLKIWGYEPPIKVMRKAVLSELK
jgi:shikimate dehydrogenase